MMDVVLSYRLPRSPTTSSSNKLIKQTEKHTTPFIQHLSILSPAGSNPY